MVQRRRTYLGRLGPFTRLGLRCHPKDDNPPKPMEETGVLAHVQVKRLRECNVGLSPQVLFWGRRRHPTRGGPKR